MDKFWKFLYIFLFGSLVVLAVTHSKGFAQSVGSLTSGFQGFGTILTGSNSTGGG